MRPVSRFRPGFDCRDPADFGGLDFDWALSFAGSAFGFGGGAVGVTVIASVNHSRSGPYGTAV